MATPWLSVFRACSTAPRGGPRTEPPRPSGCWPTTSSLYIRERGGSTSSSSPHFQLPERFEPSPFALLSPLFVAKVPPSDEVPEEVPEALPCPDFAEASSPLPFRASPRCSFLFSVCVRLRRFSGDRRLLHLPPQVSLKASTFSLLAPSSS